VTTREPRLLTSSGTYTRTTTIGDMAVSNLEPEAYRCTMSLRSELSLIRTLLKVAKRCLCPKLKSYALELHDRKVALMLELKSRSKAEQTLDPRIA
jgi:hypothetical protein